MLLYFPLKGRSPPPASSQVDILFPDFTAVDVCVEAEHKCLCIKGRSARVAGVFGFCSIAAQSGSKAQPPLRDNYPRGTANRLDETRHICQQSKHSGLRSGPEQAARKVSWHPEPPSIQPDLPPVDRGSRDTSSAVCGGRGLGAVGVSCTWP